MGFLRIIRKWALRDKMPIREIARRTGVSRNTIKKYLRTGIVEPEFQILNRPSKLDPYADKLTGWLLSEQRKSRKERRTAKQMHADLVQLGFDGSYERVAALVRNRSPISSCPTAAHFWCGPICCKRMRCCSMPTGMAFGCLRVFRGVASMTT